MRGRNFPLAALVLNGNVSARDPRLVRRHDGGNLRRSICAVMAGIIRMVDEETKSDDL
jgi:hypothetical protein